MVFAFAGDSTTTSAPPDPFVEPRALRAGTAAFAGAASFAGAAAFAPFAAFAAFAAAAPFAPVAAFVESFWDGKLAALKREVEGSHERDVSDEHRH
jgi:hypothetical protein